ncbi:Sorting nexin-3 [Exophiala xenobiotica]|uniref:Sorting nexin-3 n=1 Tax=Vermiconidia calcicola TaxID=1690605 RepID=A0AAV9PZL6_9PEZI|nr:Sorting nexin-3 [Exophiala xenobiotica]KAK5435141.1 Sorting nexin-3 [Exophiala xenobiotica]KAK5531366.1 Sorting nexin-3 [Vermiconidia calcicola]KAK5540569.1 hypothetical protein LTR23_006030 [Chaetothyriales sp. CCFEE 6169]
MADSITSSKLCATCKTIFAGGSEPFPGEGLEFFHHRSADAFRQALAARCHLCTILGSLVPPHLHKLNWTYQSSPDDQPLPEWPTTDRHSSEQSDLSDHVRALRLSARRHRDTSIRFFNLADQQRLGKHNPSERNCHEQGFAEEDRYCLAYFRCTTQRPAIWFWFLGPTGRSGVGSCWPLKIALFEIDASVSGTLFAMDSNSCQSEDDQCISETTAEEKIQLTARAWLRKCVESHGSSCSLRDHAFLPSRLLHLAHDPGSKRRIVTLRCTAEVGMNGEDYMTLSHCWGDPEKMFKLTKANLDALICGMPLEHLPRKFRQALEFASSCGIMYLWIDALCILQDDKQDWDREAPLMGSIYHNAFCNLSAGDSDGPEGTLYDHRDPLLVAPLCVPLDPQLWRRDVVNPGQLYVCISESLWQRCVEESPVNGRGWVVQERLLSPRKIFFTKQQFFWECRQNEACETLTNGMVQDLFRSRTRNPSFMDLRFLQSTIDQLLLQRRNGTALLPTDDRRKKDLLRLWEHFLKLYTRCKLTYRDDRTVAINAIAEYLETVLEDECFFGIWRNELPYQLFFEYDYAVHHNSKDSMPELQDFAFNPRVPSWSWAFHDGALKQAPFSRGKEKEDKIPLVSILDFKYGKDAEIVHDGEKLHYAAYLRLKGFVLRCTENPERNGPEYNHHRQFNVLVHLGDCIVATVVHFDQKIPPNGFILPIFRFDWSGHGNAIILTEIRSKGSRIYKRSGFVGANMRLWTALKEYTESGAEEETFYLV